MVLLELFAGVDTRLLGLTQLGIKVEQCYASEIKDAAIKCSKDNWGDRVIHIGDVTKVHYSNGVLHTENGDFKTKIDMVTSGSPCQDFSQANKERLGLDGKKSGLFFEFLRILHEVKPTYFFQENVEMDIKANNFITASLGVPPVNINSSLVSAQMRNRNYWTNIPGDEKTLFENTFSQPKDRGIKLQDILEYGYTPNEKARCLLNSDSRPLATPIKMFHRWYSSGFTTLIFKNKEHYKACKKHYDEHYKGLSAQAIGMDIIINHEDVSIYEGLRYLNQNELEACQTFPKGYTKCLTRNEAASVMGDSWNLETVKHFFKGIK